MTHEKTRTISNGDNGLEVTISKRAAIHPPGRPGPTHGLMVEFKIKSGGEYVLSGHGNAIRSIQRVGNSAEPEQLFIEDLARVFGDKAEEVTAAYTEILATVGEQRDILKAAQATGDVAIMDTATAAAEKNVTMAAVRGVMSVDL